MNDEDQKLLVARALGQTYAMGARYAAVPLPWWEWFCYRAGEAGVQASGVPWAELCDRATHRACDAEGNVILCFRERGHSGSCGRPTGTLPA